MQILILIGGVLLWTMTEYDTAGAIVTVIGAVLCVVPIVLFVGVLVAAAGAGGRKRARRRQW